MRADAQVLEAVQHGARSFYAAVLGRLELTGMLALHGMPAGAVLGWWRRG